MRRTFILITYLFLITGNVFSQLEETNIWYFGNGNGLDFSSCSPTVLTDGAINTTEGSSSISDSNGLLFYTDGITIWNKLHNQMSNGINLNGSGSSSQSALILKKPSSDSVYYVFTTDHSGNSKGFSYSEVDMRLNNGLGDVNGVKNIQLLTPVTEKLSIIPHQNKVDFWVVVHGWQNAVFSSYLISASGISAPVTTSIGMTHTGGNNAIGFLKFAPDGSKLAISASRSNKAELYDFDNNTGIMSNPIVLPLTHYTYGISFSPNSKVLYIQDFNLDINQFNIEAGDIPSSRTVVGTTDYSGSDGGVGALQLAPDGKIYLARIRVDTLGAILYPNIVGDSCVFNGSYLSLNGVNAKNGLPNFNDALFADLESTSSLSVSLGDDTTICKGDTIHLNLTVNNASFKWIDSSTTNKFNISEKGTYWVKASDNCHSIYDTIEVAIDSIPSIELGNDTTLCTSETILLDAISSNATYKWNTITGDSTLLVNSPNTYQVEVNSRCGTVKDTIIIDYTTTPDPNLGADFSICLGDTAKFDATLFNANYLWQDGSSNNLLAATDTGIYWVEINIGRCSSRDSIEILNVDTLILDLGADTTLCQYLPIVLDASNSNATYQWHDNSNTPTFNVLNSGSFYVDVSNTCGTLRDSITITFDSLPNFDLVDSIFLCDGDQFILDATSSNSTYLWQDGSNDSTFTDSTIGTYHVAVTNICGTSLDSVFVVEGDNPVIDLGNDTSFCEGAFIILDAFYSNSIYTWDDQSNQSQRFINSSGTYYAFVQNGCGVVSDTINVLTIPLPTFDLGNDTTLCSLDSFNLNINQSGTFQWNTGSNSNELNVTDTGWVWLELTANTCSFRDSILIKSDPIEAIDLGKDTALCMDASYFILDASNDFNYNYQWNTGSDKDFIVIDKAGIYWLSMDNGSCYTRDTIEVTFDALRFNLGNDTTIESGESLQIETTIIADDYLWNDGSVSNNITTSEAGIYWLEITSSACSYRDSVEVSILLPNCEGKIFIPNAFSPNNDGINDHFGPLLSCPVEQYLFKVWASNGTKVFESDDQYIKWDGHSSTKRIGHDNVFIYELSYIDSDGKKVDMIGNFLLIQ